MLRKIFYHYVDKKEFFQKNVFLDARQALRMRRGDDARPGRRARRRQGVTDESRMSGRGAVARRLEQRQVHGSRRVMRVSIIWLE